MLQLSEENRAAIEGGIQTTRMNADIKDAAVRKKKKKQTYTVTPKYTHTHTNTKPSTPKSLKRHFLIILTIQMASPQI